MGEAKFNLKQMLREIQDDQKVAPQVARQISQAEIRARVAQRRKDKAHGQ